MSAIHDIYSSVLSSVKVNGKFSYWFDVTNGLKQGCLISPFCFNLYLNDLIQEINSIGRGIQIGDKHINMLCYVDDIVLVVSSEHGLQKLLDMLIGVVSNLEDEN